MFLLCVNVHCGCGTSKLNTGAPCCALPDRCAGSGTDTCRLSSGKWRKEEDVLVSCNLRTLRRTTLTDNRMTQVEARKLTEFLTSTQKNGTFHTHETVLNIWTVWNFLDEILNKTKDTLEVYSFVLDSGL